MPVDRRSFLAGGVALSGAHRAYAQSAPHPLTDDPSRAQLFERVKAAAVAEDATSSRAGEKFFDLYGPFRFPNDVLYDVVERKKRENAIFGADISHYTSDHFPIEQLRQRQARFLYLKATQGNSGYDGKFGSFYTRVQALPAGAQVHAGAYHFLSSVTGGRQQAAFFLETLQKHGAISGGKLRETDMPPVMDLEWDIARKNGPDRWATRSRSEILAEARAFLDEVERGTGRRPMIYTARAWWRGRMGSEDLGPLAGYPQWIADYSKTSRASETPKQVGTAPLTFWQFTDSASMALDTLGGAFDANVFKGGESDFYAATGARPFA